jgi:hypothetical protein
MSSRRPSSRCDAAREPQGQWCTPMRRISMPGCPSGVTPIRPSVTPRASVPATTMALGSVRCMSTPWKAAGPCFGLGAVLTGASPKSNGRSTWASSRSFTTSGDEARRDSGHGSNSWSHSSLESGKSHLQNIWSSLPWRILSSHRDFLPSGAKKLRKVVCAARSSLSRGVARVQVQGLSSSTAIASISIKASGRNSSLTTIPVAAGKPWRK